MGQRITISGFSDGQPFDPAATYKVAINSYRAAGDGGHITKKDLRYYPMKWSAQQGTVTPKALGNWTVVPAEWWEKARVFDYGLLYEGKRLP